MVDKINFIGLRFLEYLYYCSELKLLRGSSSDLEMFGNEIGKIFFIDIWVRRIYILKIILE